MIRPATFVAMLVFVFAGLFLYQTKHRSQMLDREIAQVIKTTEETRAHTVLLRADYQMLGAPGRMEELSGALLKLRLAAPTQFTTLADLGHRLPPVGPMPNAEPPPVAVEPAPTPAPAPPPVVQKAEPAVAKPVAVATVVKPAPRPASPPSAQPVSLAAAAPPAPRPPARPAVVAAVVAPAPVRSPEPPKGSSAEAIRQIVRGGPINTAVPAVASALGMARSMGGAPDITAQAASLRSEPHLP